MIFIESNTKKNYIKSADKKIVKKYGNTTYSVNIYFNHKSEFSTEDRLKRVIINDLKKII